MFPRLLSYIAHCFCQAGSARSSANSSSTGSIYDNINPAMQEVLDRRAKAAEKASRAKPSVAKSKLKSAAATRYGDGVYIF